MISNDLLSPNKLLLYIDHALLSMLEATTTCTKVNSLEVLNLKVSRVIDIMWLSHSSNVCMPLERFYDLSANAFDDEIFAQ